jgi:hypothetical protein
MGFEIRDFKPFTKATLRGFFTLDANGIQIDGFTLHERDGRQWIGLPSKKGRDENGGSKWFPIVRIPDDERYRKFQEWAVKQVEAMRPAEGDNTPEKQLHIPF